MNDLCLHLKENFLPFYRGVYRRLSDEPSVDLTEKNVEELVGIIHSTEMRYEKALFEQKVSGIIVHTALDHILLNGNKRLSLILGYFCCHWYGFSLILLEGNFPRLIKGVVVGVGETLNQDKKSIFRQNAIEALAKEVKEYSIPRGESERPNEDLVAQLLRKTKGKV